MKIQVRRLHRTILVGLTSLGLALGVILLATPGAARGGQDKPAAGGQEKVAKANGYIGQAKCKNCHAAVETGGQHAQWLKSDHAQAFKLLGSDEAKKVATEKGIADAQKEAACLKCHVTAFAAPAELLKRGFEPADGVQCESCHGPGEKHMKARFGAAAEASAGEAAWVKVPEGEIIANPTEATCRGCHNKESPTFKRFCFPEFHAKVSHINPKKPRTQAELDAVLACGCGEACACVDACAEGCGVPASTLKDKK